MKTLYIGNLDYNAQAKDLIKLFSEFGEVHEASVILHKPSGKSKGFGFVTFASEDSAIASLSALNGKEFMGRNLVVREAKEKVENA